VDKKAAYASWGPGKYDPRYNQDGTCAGGGPDGVQPERMKQGFDLVQLLHVA
jgi:hypothetical protein